LRALIKHPAIISTAEHFILYMRKRLVRQIAAGCLLALAFGLCLADQFPTNLFGYSESERPGVTVFPQWVQVLERHLADNLQDGDCEGGTLNSCYMREWLAFLAEIKPLPAAEQITRVNFYANNKDYLLDIENYGLEDYWAIPREFLFNGGDCEDYAITKLMSLKWLGYSQEKLRIVVLQDTNLRIAHAVLALGVGDDILILDNQAEQVLSHRQIVHYAPVYSVSDTRWWMHLPQ